MDENLNATNVVETQTQTTEQEDTAQSKTEEKPTTLSAEEQLQKLMVENAKLKRAFDKTASEAADFKKKYNATLSEKEQADMAKAEAEAKRDERLAELELPVLFVGEGCRVTQREIHLPHCREVPEAMRYQSGVSVAQAALAVYEAAEDKGAFTDLALKPTYLRPSQAERERNERLKIETK